MIEFWQGQSTRIHDRIRFRRPASGEEADGVLTREGENGWIYERLAPWNVLTNSLSDRGSIPGVIYNIQVACFSWGINTDNKTICCNHQTIKQDLNSICSKSIDTFSPHIANILGKKNTKKNWKKNETTTRNAFVQDGRIGCFKVTDTCALASFVRWTPNCSPQRRRTVTPPHN